MAGRWRGRPLAAPPGTVTRPSADRTRETAFSMLVSRLGALEELAVLDLFAGTGAWGLEALSRGAARATFVEADRAALYALRANVARLGAGPLADVRALDAARLPPGGKPHHLAFLDPPWKEALAAPALASALAGGWLAPGAWVVVESAAGTSPPPPPGLVPDATRRVGRAELGLFRRA